MLFHHAINIPYQEIKMSFPTKHAILNRVVLSAGTASLLAAAMIMSVSFANAHETAKADNKTMPTATTEHPPMSGMKDMSGMKGMSMTGDVDYDFAANMRIHHQMAVEMSQAQLKNGKSPKITGHGNEYYCRSEKRDRHVGCLDGSAQKRNDES